MVCGQMQECLGKTADYYLTYHALSDWRLIREQEGEETRVEQKRAMEFMQFSGVERLWTITKCLIGSSPSSLAF